MSVSMILSHPPLVLHVISNNKRLKPAAVLLREYECCHHCLLKIFTTCNAHNCWINRQRPNQPHSILQNHMQARLMMTNLIVDIECGSDGWGISVLGTVASSPQTATDFKNEYLRPVTPQLSDACSVSVD